MFTIRAGGKKAIKNNNAKCRAMQRRQGSWGNGYLQDVVDSVWVCVVEMEDN
jgi:hypothetical protein